MCPLAGTLTCAALSTGAHRRHGARRARERSRSRPDAKRSAEVTGLEWLNTLLRASWQVALEPQCALLAAENLQEALDKARQLLSLAGATLTPPALHSPCRSGASSSSKRHTCTSSHLGASQRYSARSAPHSVPSRHSTTPPTLRLRRSRFDPAAQYLQMEFEMTLETSGFQALVRPISDLALRPSSPPPQIDTVVRPVPLLPSLRLPVALHDLSLSGRLLVGFALCPEAPGISRLETSFVDPPTMDVRVSALGLPLTDVPGVEAWAHSSLAKMLATHFVEPGRASVNACRLFSKQTLGKARGAGGTLAVAVVGAQALSAADDLLPPSAFVELRYGGVVRRTHVAAMADSPAWGALLTFPVPAECADHADLQLTLINWATPGEPHIMGDAQIQVDARSLTISVGDAMHARQLSLPPGAGKLSIKLALLKPGDEGYALVLAAEVAAARCGGEAGGEGGAREAAHPLVAVPRVRVPVAPTRDGWSDEDDGARDGGSRDGGAPHGGAVPPPESLTKAALASLATSSSLVNLAAAIIPRHQHGRSADLSGGASGALSSAATDFLSTLAAGSGASGGRGGGGGLPGMAQAAARIASAMVATAQSAAHAEFDLDDGASSEAAAAHHSTRHPHHGHPGHHHTRSHSSHGGGGHFRSPSGAAGSGSGFDRLFAAGARAVDAAVSAANANAGANASSMRSSGGAPGGHDSRNTSWEDVGLPPPGRRGSHLTLEALVPAPPGHRRSVSAGSSLDGRLGLIDDLGKLRRTSADDGGGPVAAAHQRGGSSEHELVMELQRRLLDQREALKAAQRRVRELESAVSLAEQTRQAEDVRALVEGARFLMHSCRGSKARLLWFNSSRKRLCWASGQDKKTDAASERSHFVPVALIESVELGTALFDSAAPGSGGSWLSGFAAATTPRDERAAFSIVIRASNRDAADAGSAQPFPASLHFECPPGGNGRSGREWVAAIATLVKREHEKPGLAQGGAAMLTGALNVASAALRAVSRNGEQATPSRGARAASAAKALMSGSHGQRSGSDSGVGTPRQGHSPLASRRGSPVPQRLLARVLSDAAGERELTTPEQEAGTHSSGEAEVPRRSLVLDSV